MFNQGSYTELFTGSEKRLGTIHARQRLDIETDKEQHVFGGGLNFFHPENWYSIHSLIRYTLRITGFYGRGWRNTLNIHVRNNDILLDNLPPEFDGYTILHMSDLHADMNPPAMEALINTVGELEYDICVLTGDYRAQTSGSFERVLQEMETLCENLSSPVYGILGNHDSIRMLPDMESMGIQMLLNEQVSLHRGEESISLAGVDDPHYYRVDNVEKAAGNIPPDNVSLLLSHTPEIYRQAAHAGFDAMFCGHTHGGQICLPGGVPITLDAKLPRHMGKGAWRYNSMQGYTSVGAGTCIVSVRINCPPEITLHRLRCA
ncbi:metallophosphoesterase [Solemya velum gill symbiont]|uniref:metallophosphoesterase n=1 Tax=Solemya velum gill symbiont TaxID=2340 RepID=UPI000998ACC6|nr:metallophosphoesterase [Solemya velum gill symbiont]OOZ43174.1 metallophosphoesterase [Solemya velum gill symbiont]OOZ43993.1 metallophosphoesterase [Solemya velum gill symbiont]OOZ49075.1 metallophosphoesterase [Solemya velum gill symbiont]OOZ53000.1 metallophosphoesterase [Solemya velum gill symbiont]OOZ58014.1 metallophosphoesterase [Solemya velum gill symbiont]